MNNSITKPIYDFLNKRKLSKRANNAIREESLFPAAADPGIDRVIEMGVRWLCQAQKNSVDADGGVARHYSLISGWGHSYPETSGYIVPTLLEHSLRTGSVDSLNTAKEILDWLVLIQFQEGGFQGGTIESEPCVPVTFNTGQILLGLAAGTSHFHEARYERAMRAAAEWLVETQDSDGAWRLHPTPFANPGEKVYETHVAWGLLEAAKVSGEMAWSNAATRNIEWAISKQRSNGWYEDCCLNLPEAPLTHTIGYVTRGILEGWLFTKNDGMLLAVKKTLDQIVKLVDDEGRLPGRFDDQWQPAANWVCLTGSSQLAHCLLLAASTTDTPIYFETARRLNRYVRRTVRMEGDSEIVGAVKGAHPISGDYGKFEYLNWAVKFTVDANVLERDLVTKM